jgi:hypothetical protein
VTPDQGPSDAEEILRRELERTTVQTPAIFALPLAQPKRLRPVPIKVAAGQSHCRSRARYEYNIGPQFGRALVKWQEAKCDLVQGHDGPHAHHYPRFLERNDWLVWEQGEPG